MNLGVASLLHHLKALEIELHEPSVRCDAARLDELIHQEFVEFGRSGATYTKEALLARLSTATDHPKVVADNFSIRVLATDVALLTYRSAQMLADGTLHRVALRSSIWQQSGSGWQMSFHQGTPTEPNGPH